MDNFEQLKQLWQQQPVTDVRFSGEDVKKRNRYHQQQLERTQLVSAILLLLTPAGIVWIGFFSGITFQSDLTYVAIVLIALIPALQGIINLYMYIRLRRINITAPLADHLEQWQRYYVFRKRLLRINGPLYFLLLNGAFGLYFIEILGYFPMLGRLIALGLYVAWVLYAYIVLGKRSKQKEMGSLEAILANLQALQDQLANKDHRPEE